VSTPQIPEQDQFRIDLTESDPQRHTKAYAAAMAVATILFILLTMTTDISSRILPMKDEYLQVMIPLAPDGSEAISLKSLDHEIIENSIRVRGSVMNRTAYPLSGLTAVVDLIETTGRFGQTVDLPLDPPEIPVGGTSNFETTVTLQGKPAGYSVKFHIADGPFVPHKDERTYDFNIQTPAAPTTTTPTTITPPTAAPR
jgi:hypothetical protein